MTRIKGVFFIRLFQMLCIMFLTPFILVGLAIYLNDKGITSRLPFIAFMILIILVICLLFITERKRELAGVKDKIR